MPKRRTDSTPKTATKRKKSPSMPMNNPNPSAAAAIDYDHLATAILRQSQNSSTTDSALNVCDSNSANVNHDISNWDICENTTASDIVNSTIVHSEVPIQNPSACNVIPKPATSTSPSEIQQVNTDSSTNIANLVNALLQQNSGFQTRKMCVEEWNSSKERLYYTIAIMVLQYIVPLLILCFSNFYIGFLVWARKPPGENHLQKIKEMYLAKRRTVKVLICVAVSYAISWLPLHVTTIVGSNNNQLMSQEYMQVFWMFSHWFAFTNCAVHPINYFVMDKDFRKKTKNMFGKMCCLCLKTQLQLHHRNRDSLSSHNTFRTSIKGGLVTKV